MKLSEKLIAALKMNFKPAYLIVQQAGLYPVTLSELINGMKISNPMMNVSQRLPRFLEELIAK
jgi:hypothetical protein